MVTFKVKVIHVNSVCDAQQHGGPWSKMQVERQTVADAWPHLVIHVDPFGLHVTHFPLKAEHVETVLLPLLQVSCFPEPPQVADPCIQHGGRIKAVAWHMAGQVRHAPCHKLLVHGLKGQPRWVLELLLVGYFVQNHGRWVL